MATSAPLLRRIASVLSSPDTQDPFGTVAKLLESTFAPNTSPEHPFPQLVVISVGLAFCFIFAAGSLLVRHVRARAVGSHLVFVTRQQGFIIPGSASWYLSGMLLWSALSVAYVGKIMAFFRGDSGQHGLHEIRSVSWWFLQLTGNVLIWGLKCAANMSPGLTRSVGGKDAGSSPPYWYPSSMWNVMILGRASAYIITTAVPIVVTSVMCERFNGALSRTIGAAVSFSANGVTSADQTSLQEFQGDVGNMAHHLHLCLKATEAEFICWGVWTVWNVIEWTVCLVMLGGKLSGQIAVLQRVSGDLRRARQRGVAMEHQQTNSDWSKGHESDTARDSMDQKHTSSLFPTYSASVDANGGEKSPVPDRDLNNRSPFGFRNIARRPQLGGDEDELYSLKRRIDGLRDARFNLYLQTGCWQFVSINYLLVCFLGAAFGLRTITDARILTLVTCWPFWSTLLPTIPVLATLFFKSFTLDPKTQGGLLGNALSTASVRRSPTPKLNDLDGDRLYLTGASAPARTTEEAARVSTGLKRHSVLDSTASHGPTRSFDQFEQRSVGSGSGGDSQHLSAHLSPVDGPGAGSPVHPYARPAPSAVHSSIMPPSFSPPPPTPSVPPAAAARLGIQGTAGPPPPPLYYRGGAPYSSWNTGGIDQSPRAYGPRR